MAEDPLVRLHTHGYHLQRLIDMEYEDARRDPTSWPARREGLIARWRRMAGQWAGLVERTLAEGGRDLTAASRFHNAPQSAAVPHGANVEWAGIRGFLVARLGVLDQIIESRRRSAAPPIIIAGPVGMVGGSAGVVNLGTILGNVRGSVRNLEQSGQAELARLLSQVIERLPGAHLSDPEKDEAADLTKALADEAAKPGRLSAVGRATAQALGQILTRSAELAQIWQAIEPSLR
ncbi:MAG: hypothetical protein L0Z62_21960 [Gemmataceae bacterium]|nr:hypothetical protein [Gemmataceae bacterium]